MRAFPLPRFPGRPHGSLALLFINRLRLSTIMKFREAGGRSHPDDLPLNVAVSLSSIGLLSRDLALKAQTDWGGERPHEVRSLQPHRRH